MTVTIKSIGGRDLYVAENAADVRAALIEAASKSADLRGAYLRGAYLQSADLRGAYLRGADLQSADLRGAYLQSADLQSADLRGAYLQSADLQSADLRGADLQSADLRGAYLRGAYLQSADLRGAYLRGADLQSADLRGAYLRGADLRGAYLQSADLRGADLRGAYLQSADLRGAYLQSADLRGADLRGAYLRGAKNFDPRRCNDLLMLLEQPGAIRAYKLVADDYGSPMETTGRLFYRAGATLDVPNANTDANADCAAGVNVATLPWAMQNWSPGRRVMLVEFTAADIAAIPLSDGKFRVRRCAVIRELDLIELGLVEKPAEPVAEAPAKPKRVRKAAAK
jgi:uncharacterized protein YjbI with pentapeptide repeats